VSEIDLTKLDTCGCCEDAPGTPSHVNPPGLIELNYRIGTHPTLLDRMKSRIYRWEASPLDVPQALPARPLEALKTRAADDPAIALMDAWAVVGDVLTFYQERIANECFLRTAKERRSILELARTIGYELNPGVAAETYVAFNVDDAESAPAEAPVPAGTQIQSIPASQGELPQTFETTEDLVARQAWNALTPRLTHPQTLASDTTRVYLEAAARTTATRAGCSSGCACRWVCAGSDNAADAVARDIERSVDRDRAGRYKHERSRADHGHGVRHGHAGTGDHAPGAVRRVVVAHRRGSGVDVRVERDRGRRWSVEAGDDHAGPVTAPSVGRNKRIECVGHAGVDAATTHALPRARTGQIAEPKARRTVRVGEAAEPTAAGPTVTLGIERTLERTATVGTARPKCACQQH
jgi:hypothetical protein